MALAALLLAASPALASDAARPAAATVDQARIASLAASAGLHGDIVIGVGDHIATPRAAGQGIALPWRWASVTKQLIAVLAMQEVAAGHIDLDQPIARYLPQFRSNNAGIATVRQLLRHQAGLPNPDDTADPARPDAFPAYYSGDAAQRDPLTGFCAGPVTAPPGGRWSYNNCDYMVAGALLQAVTGKPWQQLIQERIATPLQLQSLHAFPARRATRAGTVDGHAEPPVDLSTFGASAGLYGSPADLVRFDLALMNGRLLSPASLATLWDSDPAMGSIALGQWVFDAPLRGCAAAQRIVERRGAIGGVEVRNFMLPGRHIAVAVFSDHAPFAFGEVWQGSGFSFDLLSAVACPAGQ